MIISINIPKQKIFLRHISRFGLISFHNQFQLFSDPCPYKSMITVNVLKSGWVINELPLRVCASTRALAVGNGVGSIPIVYIAYAIVLYYVYLSWKIFVVTSKHTYARKYLKLLFV